MFDSTDFRNWNILANSITLMVADILSVILDQDVEGPPLSVGQEATQALLLLSKSYSKINDHLDEEDDNNEGPCAKLLYE